MLRIGVAEIVHLCFRQRTIVVVPLLAIFVILSSRQTAESQDAAYRNPRLPVEQRVADLISRMTLEEKARKCCAFGNARRRCCSMSRATSVWRKPGPISDTATAWDKSAGRAMPAAVRTAADGRAHQYHSEVFYRREPVGHPRDFSRRVSARPLGTGRDEFSATDRSGRYV